MRRTTTRITPRETRRLTRAAFSLSIVGSLALSAGAYVQEDDAADAVDRADVTEPGVSDATSEPEVDAQAAEDARAAVAAALASELASAKRFEVELDALLLPDGRLNPKAENAPIKLGSLATRCGILANSASHEAVRLLLLNDQARALAALAALRGSEHSLGRAEQLTDTAQQIAAISLPGSAAASDYWLLIANLSNAADAAEPAARKQARAERALSRYIAVYADDAEAAEYVLDARLSLAALLDQRGAQRDVAELLDRLGDLPEDSPRHAEVARLRDSVDRLGRTIAIDTISTELTPWRTADHRGKPILIHVYADSVEPSLRMIDAISRSFVEGSISGIAVVSLRVGEPGTQAVRTPWPTLPVELQRGGVLDQLGVSALPTLAWLDREGKLAAIGNTVSVLKQIETLAAESNDAEAQDAAANEADADPDADEDPASAPATDPAADAPSTFEN
jgi:hypothetical protein